MLVISWEQGQKLEKLSVIGQILLFGASCYRGILGLPTLIFSFPDSSVGREPTCNAGDPGSIPGWGRSAGEGRGYPLQYSWASLVAQLVKNLPAMQETWFRPLGWEDSPEERKDYPPQYSGLGSSMDCMIHGVAKSQTLPSNFHFQSLRLMLGIEK